MAPLEGLFVARARLETERHCNGGWRVTKGAVSHWIKRGKEEGVKGLRRSIAKGGEPRMSTEQRAQLPVLLSPGAEAFGYRGNVWTE
jgi:transposase